MKIKSLLAVLIASSINLSIQAMDNDPFAGPNEVSQNQNARVVNKAPINDECPICLEAFTADEPWQKLPYCLHRLHVACNRVIDCPYCRSVTMDRHGLAEIMEQALSGIGQDNGESVDVLNRTLDRQNNREVRVASHEGFELHRPPVAGNVLINLILEDKQQEAWNLLQRDEALNLPFFVEVAVRNNKLWALEQVLYMMRLRDVRTSEDTIAHWVSLANEERFDDIKDYLEKVFNFNYRNYQVSRQAQRELERRRYGVLGYTSRS